MKIKKSETLSFKIDPDFKDRIVQRAIEENRSLSNFVINILTNYLDDIDRAKKLLNNKSE